MNKLQALNSFWNNFGLTAYDENTVPDEAELPYITYETKTGFFNNQLTLTASLWYRSKSWKDISEKEMQISDYIGRGGVMVRYDNGAMWVTRASPWSQRMSDSNDSIRRIVLNIQIEFLD